MLLLQTECFCVHRLDGYQYMLSKMNPWWVKHLISLVWMEEM